MGTRKAKDKEYITVAEYAEARGVSTAAVYKRLENTLAPWYRVVDGKKLLLSSVLKEERSNRYNNGLIKSFEIQPNHTTTVESGEDSELIKELRAQISRQQAEADALRAAIQEKDKTISDFAARFAELAARNAELANQAQQLHAATTMIEAKSTAGNEDGPTAEKKRGRLARFLFGE